MTELSRFTLWVRESNALLAKALRKWRDKHTDESWDRMVDKVGMAVASVCVVAVFLLIAVAETITSVPQVGLP